MLLATAVLARLLRIKQVSRGNIASLEDHVFVDCSDQWTVVNNDTALTNQEAAMADL